ncbi:MAG: hypothetical protein E6R04_03625 [Spirochaetes bacterium]|nr:MAG: hypothetical protein E6R04_03625 [Spirochaetota bacterium]
MSETRRYPVPSREWFDRTPLLRNILEYAFSEDITPQGLYVHLLANAASHIRHGILTPLGTEPNLWIGTIGESGCGFSSTFKASDAVLLNAGTPEMIGTWQGFAARMFDEKLDTLAFNLDTGCSTRKLITRYGGNSRKQMEAILDGGEIVHPKYGRKAGTYRVTVRESIYPSEYLWLFSSDTVRSGHTAKFLLADIRWSPYREDHSGIPKPFVTVPDWKSVPDGALRLPPTARDVANAYMKGGGVSVERDYVALRFQVLTAHAALHGRTVPTDDDWDATAEVMRMSRTLFDIGTSACAG